MDTAERKALETRIRAHHDAGELTDATTVAINGYGSEILSYLMAVLRHETEASDVFANFCETLWTTLADFRWECSFRTWAYTLARHAVVRLFRDPQRKLGQPVPLSKSPEVWEMAERVRTTTLTYLRTETRDRYARLREQLDTDDQTLLILRINREMPWNDIARIMSNTNDLDAQLQRKSSALRKRFQRVKETLRDLARAEGIAK